MIYTRKTEDVFDLMYDYGYGDGLERISLALHIRKLWQIVKLILRTKGFDLRL